MNIAINGFGRIGRTITRLLTHNSEYRSINIAAINIGTMHPEIAALLFEFDTAGGTYPGDVALEANYLIINGKKIKFVQQPDLQHLDWKTFGVTTVVECTGVHTNRAGARAHKNAGCSHVLLCAPCADADKTVIIGVNNHEWDVKKDTVISLGSCTTNAAVPLLFALNELAPIKHGALTTIHAYTATQALIDSDMHDARRSRAAGLNIVPSSTGALEGIAAVMPELKDKLTTLSVRVPVAKVSLLELAIDCSVKINAKTIHTYLQKKQESTFKNIVQLSDKPLVSSDFAGNYHSVIVDTELTTTAGPLIRICGWYDNEVGYSARVCDAIRQILVQLVK